MINLSKSKRMIIFIIFAIAFIQTVDSAYISNTGSIRKIQKNKNIEVQDDIFTNATIHRTQSSSELYLADRVVKLLNLPDVMQATDYTCGPTSLLAILSYLQISDLRQSDLAKMAKCTQQSGTQPEDLFAVLQTLKIPGQYRQNMTNSDLQYQLRNNRPILVLIQAWKDDETPYVNDFDDGHYVVAIGYDKDYFYFEDPWILGNIGYIPKNQFPDRWHGYGLNSRKVYGVGMYINEGQKNKPVIIKLE